MGGFLSASGLSVSVVAPSGLEAWRALDVEKEVFREHGTIGGCSKARWDCSGSDDDVRWSTCIMYGAAKGSNKARIRRIR